MTHHGDEGLADFKEALRALRLSVGNPPNSWFAQVSFGLARQTLHDLLRTPRRPRWETVEHFLAACESYIATEQGTRPDDREALRRSEWLQRYIRLSDGPGDGGSPEITTSADRQLSGVLPHAAGGYQDRGLAATFGEPGPRQHVLTGLGGVGKTQVAARLARQLWEADEIDHLIWVQASSRDGILDGYRLAWASLGGGDDDERAAPLFLNWLSTTDRRWLVVLDDLADPAHLGGLWPPVRDNGRTVVTTRRADASLASDGRRIVRIGPFTEEESLAYVRRKLGDRPDLIAGAERLVAELGGLPLALSQAVVYQLDTDLSCADYLDRLGRLRLRDAAPDSLPDDQTAAVSATWELSLRHADELRPARLATPVLRMAALLDPDGIPETLFATAAVTAALGVRADDVHDALRCLRRVSLIDIDQEDHGRIRVHSLVQRVTREDTPPPVISTLRRAAADGLMEILPHVRDDRELRARLHANAVALIDDSFFEPGVHELVLEAGRSGGVEAAIGHLSRAVETAAAHLGRDHADVLRLRHLEMYRLGDAEYYEIAADLAAVLIGDCERVFGRYHSLTVEARIYHARALGHLDAAAAIPLLTGLRAEIGPDHPEILTVRNDLAHFRGEAGDPGAAAEEMRLLAEDRARLLGPLAEHTLISRNGYGYWLGMVEGRLDEAIGVLSRVHADCAEALGPDHLFTLGSHGNLVYLLGLRDGPARHLAAMTRIHARLLDLHGVHNRQTRKFEGILRGWR